MIHRYLTATDQWRCWRSSASPKLPSYVWQYGSSEGNGKHVNQGRPGRAGNYSINRLLVISIIIGKDVSGNMMFEDKIRVIVDRVTEHYDPKAIIVFGSVARGDSTEDSDLDIAIIMDSDLSEHERNVKVRVCIGSIGMAMDLLVFTPEEIEAERNDESSIISEIMRTGEVVYGSA